MPIVSMERVAFEALLYLESECMKPVLHLWSKGFDERAMAMCKANDIKPEIKTTLLNKETVECLTLTKTVHGVKLIMSDRRTQEMVSLFQNTLKRYLEQEEKEKSEKKKQEEAKELKAKLSTTLNKDLEEARSSLAKEKDGHLSSLIKDFEEARSTLAKEKEEEVQSHLAHSTNGNNEQESNIDGDQRGQEGNEKANMAECGEGR